MKKTLKNPALQIGSAAILGIVFGLLVGDWAANLKFVGDLFIRLIQMAIVPLVMTSVIVATGAMSGSGMGRMAFRTFKWMIGFSVVAAILAWGISVVIQPGAGIDFSGSVDPALQESAAEATGWQDTVVNFVSTNIFAAMSTATMVPIVIFSLLFGVALNAYIAKTGNRLVLDFFDQIQQIVLTMIRFVMVIAPVGVFCLLANLAGTVGFAVGTSGLKYLGSTLIGVLILLVLFVVVVWLRTGLNPAKLPAKLSDQTMIAITTTSSAVTYPTVLKTAIEKFGVSQPVANFTLSVGLTMGSYGAVLNYMIVVMFLVGRAASRSTSARSCSAWPSRSSSTWARSRSQAGSRSSRCSSRRPWGCPSRLLACSSPSTGSRESSAPSSTSTATPSSRCSSPTPATRSTGMSMTSRSR